MTTPPGFSGTGKVRTVVYFNRAMDREITQLWEVVEKLPEGESVRLLEVSERPGRWTFEATGHTVVTWQRPVNYSTSKALRED